MVQQDWELYFKEETWKILIFYNKKISPYLQHFITMKKDFSGTDTGEFS
jgi:hypothetical protein